MTGCGLTFYFGTGWALHLSTEDGVQLERAPHRTLRLGLVVAIRRTAVVRNGTPA